MSRAGIIDRAFIMSMGRMAGGGTSAGNGIEHWVNVNAIQLIAHHTSAVVAAVVMFWLVGFIVQRFMHDTTMRRCVLLVDEFVLLCLFVYFAYELFLFL